MLSHGWCKKSLNVLSREEDKDKGREDKIREGGGTYHQEVKDHIVYKIRYTLTKHSSRSSASFVSPSYDNSGTLSNQGTSIVMQPEVFNIDKNEDDW